MENAKSNLFVPSNPLTAEEAFYELQGEISAISDDALVAINVDIPFAVENVLGRAPRIDLLLPELARLPDYDLRPARTIRTYAGAALHAHLAALGVRIDDPELPSKIEAGYELRASLLLSAETLVHFGLMPERQVAAIRSGTGPMDMANDLSALSALFRSVWAEVSAKVAVTEAMVDDAARLGFELHALLGARRADSSTGSKERQRTRERAFACFVRAYDHVRRGVCFLRWDQGDADEFAPSLYLRRRRRSAATRETDASVTSSEPPVPSPPSESSDSADTSLVG